MKTKKLDSGRLEISHGDPLIRVELFDGYFSDTPIAKFFLPVACKDNYGFIPEKIIKYRLKHDFNIEVGHCSVRHKLKSNNVM